MASKWRIRLVEPPRARHVVIAFSKAFFVIISRGRIFFSSKLRTASPAFSQSFFLLSPTAVWALLPGKLIPNASIALAMVFAVYIPPQEPGPGIALFSTSFKPSSSRVPFACFPTASKTDTISIGLHFSLSDLVNPGKIVPP